MKTEADMTAMTADVKNTPKGEDLLFPRVKDKEPAPMKVELGRMGGTIVSSAAA